MSFETTYFLKQGIRWALLAITPAALLIAGYLYMYESPQSVTTVDEDFTEDPVVEEQLEGTILISLVSPEGNVLPVLLDTSTGEVFDLPVSILGDSEAESFQYSASKNDTFMTFLGVNKNTFDESLPDSFDIYRADIERVEDAQGFIDSLETAQVLTQLDVDDYFKQTPVVSELGEVLYTSINLGQYTDVSDVSIATIPANDWRIYKIDTQGKKAMVTQGLYPKWLDANTFVFLKNDGIYMYNLQTGEEQLVWEVSEGINVVNGFDVSDDGSYFMLTSPAQGRADLVEVVDWNEKVFFPSIEFSITATNPVFSHDSEFVAMVVSWQDKYDQEKVDSGVEYYSLARGEFLPDRITLDYESVDGIYLTDWR